MSPLLARVTFRLGLARVASRLGLLHPPHLDTPAAGVSLIHGWPYPRPHQVHFPAGMVDAFRSELDAFRRELAGDPGPMLTPHPQHQEPTP